MLLYLSFMKITMTKTRETRVLTSCLKKTLITLDKTGNCLG